jgi:hypothetical protein
LLTIARLHRLFAVSVSCFFSGSAAKTAMTLAATAPTFLDNDPEPHPPLMADVHAQRTIANTAEATARSAQQIRTT